jgi:hypothetical protein
VFWIAEKFNLCYYSLSVIKMDEERKRLLAKTITVKKENLGSLKRFHLPGEAAYDYASCLSTKDSKVSFKRVCGPVSSSVDHHDMSRRTTTRITSSPIPSGVNIECSESEPCDNGIDLNVNDLLPEMVCMKHCSMNCAQTISEF